MIRYRETDHGIVQEELTSGVVVQHFKRETLSPDELNTTRYLYRIICIAYHTETNEKLVVYQALYDDLKYFARPLNMFMGEVDHEKYPNIKQRHRFEIFV